jgi:hypothetical protein
MRAEFQGGVCDGHSHPVGPVPPETLAAPCRSVLRGRYVRAGSRIVKSPNGLGSSTTVTTYQWESPEERVARLG